MGNTSKSLNMKGSAAVTFLVMLFNAIGGDYFFDLNDDVLMKDLLSGAYTGVPEGHNIQMLYPISALISVLYRISGALDWYGIFLCLLQAICVFVITYKLLEMSKDSKLWLFSLVSIPFMMLGVIGAHFLFVQYTFTCGFLSATAVILIFSHREKDKSLYLAAVLIAIAYLLRSEMLLLTLPVVMVGILIKWALTGKEFRNYLKLLVSIVLIIVASQVIHKLAYSSAGWRDFTDLFNARTELYDFQYIPDYAENKEFYDSIGLSESEHQLLVNYNFGLDEEINADTLWAVAEYADKLKTDELPLTVRLCQATGKYLYRLRHFSFQKSFEYPVTDFPWNVVAFVLYIGVILMYLFPKKEREKKKAILAVALTALLFACRTTLWLYIIVRGRDPIRITHPLYLMEIVVLLGMLYLRAEKSLKIAMGALAALIIVAIVSIPNQVFVLKAEMASREKMRQHYDALYDYFADNKDNFYFIDVYTSVSCGEDMVEGETFFSEKMFKNVDNSYANHDLMGGWASKSPLTDKKFKAFGFDSMQDAILLDNVYIVQNKSEDIQWLNDYYVEKGYDIQITQADTVADAFAIYKVSLAQ
ncbi:Dolichyl-phosphate-mannose-protein mannosyltransferase [Butyrivibrio proteoclasticus]|uniref:Dolichyl-phosphate-mannose-protein mannosyltransferase n=1 Tax=Butyrivibrio proteoclasticus TaxID=43305 RepID=A0A1I5PIT9_9FIRM|nr:glycosyltransferase family 39 protein [Butyrivibrio proteoclasticus]SFP34042.1 Dolichyl-phosphate-mannose-protein mannosyltransferase [Butyrivibrio proteoclasticus]